MFIFFFSSRRRHTRSLRDWSSDVCSSDLTGREAMAELRRMVGVLRRPEEAPALAPQPSLEHLEKLVEHARESGRSEERRVGKECRSRGASSHRKKKLEL